MAQSTVSRHELLLKGPVNEQGGHTAHCEVSEFVPQGEGVLYGVD
jgi:hypothetical protein